MDSFVNVPSSIVQSGQRSHRKNLNLIISVNVSFRQIKRDLNSVLRKGERFDLEFVQKRK